MWFMKSQYNEFVTMGLTFEDLFEIFRCGIFDRSSLLGGAQRRRRVGQIRFWNETIHYVMSFKQQGQVGQKERRVDRQTNALQTDRPTNGPTNGQSQL